MGSDHRDNQEHPQPMRQFFTTHSHSWRDVGLARQLSRRAVKRARIQSLVLLPVRESPRISLEELDGDEVVVRISAMPERPADGPKLASEVLEVVGAQAARGDD